MSLARCRECEGHVSTEAPLCPHCGATNPALHREQTTAQAETTIGGDEEGSASAQAKSKSGMFGWVEGIKTSAEFRRVPLARMIWDLVKLTALSTVLVWVASLMGGVLGTIGFIVMLLVSLLCSALWYMLPTLVAYHRDNRSIASIAVVNTFFGWTFVGWVAALSWAVKK